jgi:endonuclease/exonuclease/phosphatase family metal-dependent hydrolase
VLVVFLLGVTCLVLNALATDSLPTATIPPRVPAVTRVDHLFVRSRARRSSTEKADGDDFFY